MDGGDLDEMTHRTETVSPTGIICDTCGAVFATTRERDSHYREAHA